MSTWFRDYLYIPLGGNRKGILRKYLNIMVVFCVSGLWHGADWTYVIWGGLNGVFQVIGDMYEPIRDKLQPVLGLKRKALSHRIMKIIVTFTLVDFSWIFFRASNMEDAIKAVKSILTMDNPWVLFDSSLYTLGLAQKEYQLMWVGIILLIVADFMKYKGICIRKAIMQQEWWFRWAVGIIGVIIVLTLGMYGYGYDAQNFIYFQF